MKKKRGFLRMLLGTLGASLLGNILAVKQNGRARYRNKQGKRMARAAYASRAHWIFLYILDNDAIYFDIFGIEHVPKEIKKFIGNKIVQTNVFRIQAISHTIQSCAVNFALYLLTISLIVKA